MSVKVLIRRDSIENFTTTAYIPKEHELIVAYTNDSNKIIFKIGNGKTTWAELPEVKTIEEIDRFKVYYNGKEAIEMFLKPESIQEFLDTDTKGDEQNGTKDCNT